MRIFISHSSANAGEAQEVCGILEQAGHKCFLAPRDIRSGHEYAEEIIDGIDGSDAVVLLLSEAANSSPHVLREVERAVSKKLSVIVYKLEDVNLSKSMEYFLMTHQWVSEKSDRGYKGILDCINGLKEKNDSENAEEAIQPSQPLPASKMSKTGIAVKAAVGGAAAAVCIAAAVLIASNVHRPSSAMNENIVLTDSENNVETISETEAPAETAVLSETENAPSTEAETSENVSASAENTEGKKEAAETAEEAVSEQLTEAVYENTSQTAETTAENTAPDEQTEAVTEASVMTEPIAAEPKAELGDSFILGEYLGEPIKWRVIQLSEDGNTAVVISDGILTMKAFDTAEGGKYNFYNGEYYWNVPPAEMTRELERLVRGDNRWELSNLRIWLNSDRDNVTYSDQEPNSRAMSELKNGYNTEAGFLKSFGKNEKDAILTTRVVTDGTVTEDRVYLLSRDELSLLDAADVSVYAVPTDSAAEQDQSGWYRLNVGDYNVRDHYWWLRDPDTDTASEVYIVNFSYAGDKVFSHSAGLEGYGVRPVMTVDLTADCIVID
ncbi:MAG: DUF6273 domain-containing protein [Bacteroides sp.]|nr:DUF6273 domain-containing protein [Bacteroides sp.]